MLLPPVSYRNTGPHACRPNTARTHRAGPLWALLPLALQKCGIFCLQAQLSKISSVSVTVDEKRIARCIFLAHCKSLWGKAEQEGAECFDVHGYNNIPTLIPQQDIYGDQHSQYRMPHSSEWRAFGFFNTAHIWGLLLHHIKFLETCRRHRP